MKHGEVRVLANFPPDENASESVHPAVGPLDDPSSCLDAGLALEFLLLFAPAAHVKCEPVGSSDSPRLLVVECLVQAEALGRSLRRPRASHWDAVDRFRHQFVVVPIRPVNRQTEGHARAIDQEAAFGTVLGAIGWVWSGFFPPRGAPSSWPHPSTSNSSRCPSPHRRPEAPGARTRETLPRPATPGIVGTPTRRSRCPSRPERSTGNRFGARKESRPWHFDLAPEAGGIRAGARGAGEAAAPAWPRGRRTASNWAPWRCVSCPYKRARSLIAQFFDRFDRAVYVAFTS